MAVALRKKYRILAIDDEAQILDNYHQVLTDDAVSIGLKLQLSDLEKELFAEDAVDDFDEQVEFALETRDNGEDGFTAITEAILADDPFDAVFIDVRMPPGINGVEAAKLIRKMDPNVRIVIVSGYSDYTEEEIKRRIKPEDQIFYVQKPFRADQIRELAKTDKTKG